MNLRLGNGSRLWKQALEKNFEELFDTPSIHSGGGGCAAHRPPHQKGKTKSASKCKSVAIALIKASRNEVPVAAKGLG